MADNNDQNIKITFDTNAGKVAQETNKLGTSIDNVTNATNENNQAVGQSDEVYKSFKTQLREANAELQKSIQLYGETSDETVKAAKSVADLKDQMGFAKDLSDSFNPDQKMKALGAATQLAGTGLQGVTAGMALFGDQSEDTEKMLLKVQAAMAFSDAISGLSNLSDQWTLLKNTIAASSIATKANAAATGAAAIVQNVFTGSVNTTSAGFKALRLAIAGTGIGLLVVGLAMVVTNFDKISGAIMKAVPGLAKVGDFIGGIVNSITDFIGVTSEADRAISRMKASADTSLSLNKKYLSEHESQLDEFTKQKIAAKNKYLEAIKEEGADRKALALELNRQLAKIEYSRGDDARKIAKENAEKQAEEAKKRREKAIEDAKKKAEEDKKNAEDLVKSNFEAEQETLKSIQEADKKRFEESQEEKQRRDEEDSSRQVANWNHLADEQKKINDVILEQESFKEEKKKEIADKGIGFLNVIAGKNKAIQKAAIVAEGIVSVARSIKNTIEGNAGALARSILTLGPIAGPPAAAPAIALNTAAGGLSVATTIAQTAKALQALGGGGGSVSGGGGGSVSVGGSAPPSVAFNNSAENQIGQSVAKTQAEQPPLQVYVLESDITTSQNNVSVLVNKNKF